MSATNAACQVLVVEDDPLVRRFFCESIRKNGQLSVLHACGTVQEALQFLCTHGSEVDVLLTDLGLPDGSGLAVIRAAVSANKACEPLVISMFGDDSSVVQSIEAGALGYIHKDVAPEDISKTILDMRNGESPISPLIARRILQKFRSENHVAESVPENRARFDTADSQALAQKKLLNNQLSARETEILDLIAQGYSYQEISDQVHLSVHTVQTHIKRTYIKLGVHSKNEAVFKAAKLGIINALQ